MHPMKHFFTNATTWIRLTHSNIGKEQKLKIYAFISLPDFNGHLPGKMQKHFTSPFPDKTLSSSVSLHTYKALK